jgi:cob(I)alamin adenosyltransferase
VACGGSIPTPRLYTRTGDRGATGLAGGARVAKDSARIRAYGTLDELAAHLGWVEATLPGDATAPRTLVRRLEHELFVAMSELANAPGHPPPAHRISDRHVRRLEEDIDRLEGARPPLTHFVLPRGTPASAALHVARTVARRAERELWALHRNEPVPDELLRWLNRLSDLLFALAVTVNADAGEPETAPQYDV